MEELRDYIHELTDRFRGQPIWWQEMAAGIKPSRLTTVPPGQEWNPHQVFAHVMAVDQFALRPRLSLIMNELQPELVLWDEVKWMAESYEGEQPLDSALQNWQQERASLAEELVALDLEDWKRTGMHQIQGERTLLWWLEYAVNHVSNHRDQLADILASGASVGG